MTDTRQSHGLILTCDATGVIEAVIADGLHLGAARHVGESFVYLMDAACIGKALRMLADVQAGHTVAGWELNLRVDNHVHALQFAAFQRGQSIFIVGAVQDTEMLRLYEDLARMNNEQITAMRRAVKERAMAAPTFAAPPADLYDDLMRINNELVTLQRELNQKNRDLSQLAQLHAKAEDPRLGAAAASVKLANKRALAARIARDTGVQVDPVSLFDVQIKRIHEYKRQLLNVLHVIARWQAIVANPGADWVPRTVIFAGKAASAYFAAKLTIQLIHDVARVVNSDPRVGGRLKVVFLPNYGVSLAEAIIPAADLSEQISTAGTEASGTGNMKFALNGALTIGTWDGANIEMAQAIGEERLFIFGLRADAVARMKQLGYDPRLYVEENAQLRAVIDAIADGRFSPGEPERYRPLVQTLLQRDPYLLMADFADYLRTQQRVDSLYRDPAAWQAMALHNIAGMGHFSVDRTIRAYVTDVWGQAAGQ